MQRGPYKSRPEGSCSKCLVRPKTDYSLLCRECLNAYKRGRSKKGEARRRDIIRSTANVYQRRGLLTPQACERCGSPEVEKHHPAYDLPLFVRWFCKQHHREHHAELLAKPWKQNIENLRAQAYRRKMAGLD